MLADAVRDELATRHLLHDRRRASEVALLLGFSSQSAFSRWFSQRHGRSVTAWRALALRQRRCPGRQRGNNGRQTMPASTIAKVTM